MGAANTIVTVGLGLFLLVMIIDPGLAGICGLGRLARRLRR